MRLNSPKLSQNHQARWSLIRTRCLVSALETALGPTEDKYLDQTLVLGLALAVPIEDATIAVRSVVNSIRDAPKKIKAGLFCKCWCLIHFCDILTIAIHGFRRNDSCITQEKE